MGNYLLQSYLDESWRADPEKPALIDDLGSVSYEELHADANRIANCLRQHGIQRQDRIIICMKRCSRVVIAMLGILKADAIYVPVDVKIPRERLVNVVKDCQPSAIICDETGITVVNEIRKQLQGVRLLIDLGAKSDQVTEMNRISWQQMRETSAQTPRYGNIDADAAYILYTSGSTGTPKGVVVSHLNVINYIEWAVDYFEIQVDERILGTAPFHFDMSTFDIFTTLKAGATLCIAPQRHLLFPNQLLDLIEKERVTLWKGISSLLMYLSTTGSLKEERIPSLEKVLFGGEVLATKHLIKWMALYPSKQFYNVYGPTEATGISACYHIDKAPASAEESIPIGMACSNTEIFILGDGNRRAGVGETGELCIRGSGVSMGYWRDDEKTARAFVRNPSGSTQHDRIYRTGDLARMREDGVFEYLGRQDFQVKYMGYRIELFEIENAILSLDNIHQAAVLLCDSIQAEVPELVAFVAGPNVLDLDLVQDELGLRLPAFMLPKRIVPLAEMPLTDRGKTDRAALRSMYQTVLQGPGKGA